MTKSIAFCSNRREKAPPQRNLVCGGIWSLLTSAATWGVKFRLGFAFGLAEAGDAVARFPLAAFLEEFEALKAFEHVSFTAQSSGCAQAAML